MKLALLGVKVTVPSALSTTTPPVPLLTEAMLRVLPSASVSLPSSCAAVKVVGPPSVATSVSLTATGASFNGATLTVTLALLLSALAL